MSRPKGKRLRRANGVVCEVRTIHKYNGAPWQRRSYTLRCGVIDASSGTLTSTTGQVTCLACIAASGRAVR